MHVFGLREEAASGKSMQAQGEHTKGTQRNPRQAEPIAPIINPCVGAVWSAAVCCYLST